MSEFIRICEMNRAKIRCTKPATVSLEIVYFPPGDAIVWFCPEHAWWQTTGKYADDWKTPNIGRPARVGK